MLNVWASRSWVMAEAGYPQLAAHQREHQALVEKVTGYQRSFESGQLGLSLEVMEFLKDWLLSHISNVDQQYTPYLEKAGAR